MSSPGISLVAILGVLALVLGGGALLFVLIRASRSEHGFSKAQKIGGAFFGLFTLVAIGTFVISLRGPSEPEDETILVTCPGAEFFSGEVSLGKGEVELPRGERHMHSFPGTPSSNEVTEHFFPGFRVNSISSYGLTSPGAQSLRYALTVTAVSGSHPDGIRDSFLLVLRTVRGDTLLGRAIPEIPTTVWLLRLHNGDRREIGDVNVRARGAENAGWMQRWLGAVAAPSFEVVVEDAPARPGETYFIDRWTSTLTPNVESPEGNR